MGKMQKNTWIIRYIDSNNTIQVTADSGCERRLRTTRMAAALWIMAAAAEAARRMQRRRRRQRWRRQRQAENQNWCVLRQAVSGRVISASCNYLLTSVGSWRKMQMDLPER